MPYISPRHAGGGRHVYPCECFQQIIWGLQPDDKSNFEVLENMKTHSDSGECIPARWYIYGKNSDTRCFAARDNTDGDQKTACQR